MKSLAHALTLASGWFQLDKLIETTVQQFESQSLPQDVTQAQMLLKEHEQKKHMAERVRHGTHSTK